MRNIKLLLILLTVIVSGCSTTSTMNKIMGSWHGEHLDAVIEQWGYPTSQANIAGRQLYYWQKTTNSVIPIYTPQSGSFNVGTTSGTYRGSTTSYIPVSGTCVRVLEVDDKNIVKRWQWEGDDCCVMAVSGACKSWLNPRTQ